MHSSVLSPLYLFSLFLPFISSQPTPISLSLHPFPQTHGSPDPLQKLTQLASASLTRATHIKNRPNPKKPTFLSKTPLFPHSYGYSIYLDFGTPPQKSSLVMDTGSHLVWVPCTHSYLCRNCSFLNQPTNQTPSPFIPKFSSSSKLVGCSNPKCSWISDSDSLRSNCPGCDPKSPLNCSQTCPPYFVLYGSGSTGGLLLSETLVFPEKEIPDFGFGCSLFSTRMPTGIAGFGRGPSSLPSQLGLGRFAYCLLSHRFDDTANSSSLVLDGGSGPEGLAHTPFLPNPTAGNPAFSVYYYVGLRKVTVGGKTVKIPYRCLRSGSDGNGGAIVDSGTTFTYMERHAFDPVAREFVAQVGSRYRTVPEVESLIGLRPCFNVSGDTTVTLPELSFHFKGGAEMDLPLANYFSLVDDLEVACLTMVTDSEGSSSSGGPSIVLGNFQQQNFYMEFDLKKDRMGFRRKLCS